MTAMNPRPGPWPSKSFENYSDLRLRVEQDSELRCTRLAAQYNLPVDETCALAVDRIQDEIDRRNETGGRS